MLSSPRTCLWWIIVLFSLALSTRQVCAATTLPVVPEFVPVAWLPSAISTLGQSSVSATGITLGDSGHRINDTVTILAQSSERNSVRQWAVVLSLSDIKPEEKLMHSPAFTVYLGNGNQVDFPESGFEGMLIHVFGPFSNTKGASRAKDIWSGSLVNPAFLGLGMHDTAKLFARASELARNDPTFAGPNFAFDAGPAPFPESKVAVQRAGLAPLNVTREEERAFAGMVPAFMDFFRIASQTPGVRDIIFEAADIPWWSIAAKGGRITDTRFELIGPFGVLSPGDWGLPEGASVYSMGLLLRLQGKPALVCRLALTTPSPPLLNTAGIIGIAAMRPDGKGPRVMFRVMAGRLAHIADAAGGLAATPLSP